MAGAACFRDSTGLHGLRSAYFSVVPVFSTHAARVVDFDRVRIVLHRFTGAVALDTVVDFPADADSINLNLRVTIATGGSETFTAKLKLISGSDTVFRGESSVTATAGLSTNTATVPLHYSGIGANAAAVELAVADTSVYFADSVLLVAVAFDSAHTAIPNTPLEWESLDTTRAIMRSAVRGLVVARSQRGIARIVVETPTALADTARVTVQPTATALAIQSGDGQGGAAHTQLAQPLVVAARGADALGVRGVAVRFAIMTGNGSLSDTLVATDTAGLARTRWTTGTVARTDSVQASIVGRPIAPVIFTSAVAAGPAKALAITAEPGASTAGAPISPAVQVAARDTFGNIATGFTGAVALALGANPGGAALSGTDTVAAAAGVASFADLRLDKPGTGYTLVATAGTLTPDTTAAFDVTPAPAAALVFTTGPAGRVAGDTQTVVVTAHDALGNVATGFTGNVTLAIGANPGGATLGGTTSAAAVAGVATFHGLTLDKSGTGYTLTAAATGPSGATSAPFNVAAGPASVLVVTTQPPASVIAGAGFGVVIAARDALGNVATGFAGTVTLAITAGTGTAGAALRGTTSQAATAGVASFTALSVDSVGTGYTLTAASAPLPGVTTTAFAVTVGAAVRLAFSTQPPDSAVYQAPFGFAVVARDTMGNAVPSFAGSVTVAIGANPSAGTLSGTLTQTASAGVATFSGVSVDNIGTGYTLRAGAAGLDTATSTAIRIVAPPGVNAWINAAGGVWSNAANWSRSAVPVATDTVAIKQSGTYTVDLDQNATIAGLQVGAPLGQQTLLVTTDTLAPASGAIGARGVLALGGSGVVADTGTLDVTGALQWTGGTLGGGGRTRVLPGGTLSIALDSSAWLRGHRLELSGSGTWAGAGYVYMLGGDTLRVMPGGVLDVQKKGSIELGAEVGMPVLDNRGTIRRTTSPDTFAVRVGTTGAGAWSLESGTLELGAAGTLSGVTNLASGTTLLFSSGGMTYGAGSSVGGGGVLEVRAGTVRFGGIFNTTGPLRINGGAAVFTGAGQTIGELVLENGLLTDSGQVTVTGPTTWTSGNINVAAGTLHLAGGSGASFTGAAAVAAGATLDFAGGTFDLTGGFTTSGGGAVTVSGGSLSPGMYTADVGGDFATLGSGSLTMGNAYSGLTVRGNATFGGAAGALGAGTIFASGNFTQSGPGTAFSPTGTRVVLTDTLAQTVSFANPGSSYFQRLDITKTAGDVTLSTNVRAVSFRLVTGSVYGNAVRVTADTAAFLSSGSMTVLKELEVTTDLSVAPGSEGFGVQTIIFSNPVPTFDEPIRQDIWFRDVRVTGRAKLDTTSYPPIRISGSLYVDGSAARLDAAGTPLWVYGNLVVQNGGQIVLAQSRDSVAVDSSATFAGAASTLERGTLYVGGNFTQGGAADAFAPRWIADTLPGTQVVLNGAGDQTLAFANSTSSFFRQLRVAKSGGGVVLGSNMRAGFFGVGSATKVTGPGARLLVDTLIAARASDSIVPHVVEVRSVLDDSAAMGFSPDTTVFTGVDQVIPAYHPWTEARYAYKSIRVAQASGTASPSDFLTASGDLVVSSGAFSLTRWTVTVGRDFRTEGTGALVMTSPTDNLTIGRNAMFGGSGTNDLGAGLISVAGDFAQVGTGTVFAPYGTRVKLVGDTTGTQIVRLADPVNNGFYDLEVTPAATDTVTLQSDVTVADSLIVSPYSEVLSRALERLRVTGGLRMPAVMVPNTVYVAGALHPFVLELSQQPNVDYATQGGVWPDTTVFLGSGGYALPYGNSWKYKSIRISTSGAISCGSGCGSLANDLVIGGIAQDGKFAMGDYSSLNVIGKLRTQGNGVLEMNATTYAWPSLSVDDSVVFAGGDETGLLKAGYLYVRGPSFVQTGPTPTSFVGDSLFEVAFDDSIPHTVRFASPGLDQSRFAVLRAWVTDTITGLRFESSAFVTGQLRAGYEGYAYKISGRSGDSLVVTGGFDVFAGTGGMQMDSLRLVGKVANDTAYIRIDNVVFGKYDPRVNQFYFEKASGAFTFFSLTFLTQPDTGYYYLWVNDTDATPNLFVDMYNPTPFANPGIFLKTENGAIITWPSMPG